MARSQGSFAGWLWYFLKLGTTGFGGPIALAGNMERDLVETRRWISRDDYLRGLALAQMAPGPLAAQLAMYLGWVRARTLGATLVSIAFILPSFLMVWGLSAVYLRFGGLAWIQAVFYGIGAAVIAIIARSSYKLARLTVGQDKVVMGLFAASAIITAWTESEIIWAILLCGLANLVIRERRRLHGQTLAVAPWILVLTGGLSGSTSTHTLLKLGWYFFQAGAIVFGSGLAIVPFLHTGVVNQFHWLTDRQFLDAVAVAMITPGPVVITSAFIGYLVGGPAGSGIAAAVTFLPCYLVVVLAAPFYGRLAENRIIKAVIDGITAGATGAIAGAVYVLGKRAIVDWPTAIVCLATLTVLLRAKKAPEPLLIAAAAIVGLLAKVVLHV